MKGENVPNFKMNTGIRWYIQCLPDPARSTTETVLVQFQYSAQYGTNNEYSTAGTDRNFFKDHHTLLTSHSSYDNKTG